ASKLMHGKTSMANLDTDSLIFKGMEPQLQVARYHSLAALESSMPDCLKVIATTDSGDIMAVEHRTHKVYGVQFHPESVLTPLGYQIVKNFLEGIEND
ncbi:MAG: gamma-glutamyl-gamma-aminobutyrate hydrolase family protein, partial [Eubacteriales bacterium]